MMSPLIKLYRPYNQQKTRDENRPRSLEMASSLESIRRYKSLKTLIYEAAQCSDLTETYQQAAFQLAEEGALHASFFPLIKGKTIQ